jgi:hypothetical protein
MSDLTFRKIGVKVKILKDHAWVHRPLEGHPPVARGDEAHRCGMRRLVPKPAPDAAVLSRFKDAEHLALVYGGSIHSSSGCR